MVRDFQAWGAGRPDWQNRRGAGVEREGRKRNPKPSFAPVPQGLVSRGYISPFCRPQCLLLPGLKRVKNGLQVRFENADLNGMTNLSAMCVLNALFGLS